MTALNNNLTAGKHNSMVACQNGSLAFFTSSTSTSSHKIINSYEMREIRVQIILNVCFHKEETCNNNCLDARSVPLIVCKCSKIDTLKSMDHELYVYI